MRGEGEVEEIITKEGGVWWEGDWGRSCKTEEGERVEGLF